MSNPTTPFGWQMPTATDLVTDLPADFEVFGQAVATSMGDLLGGTTGQILAKNSNTDMDFVWVTNDVGDITAVTAGTGISGGGTSGAVTITNSMATAIDAKGDLIAGTGADAFSRLAVGTNGRSLVSDSGETTGMKWGFPTSLGCQLYKDNQSINNVTQTALSFNYEIYDTSGFHDNTTNNSRITIPAGLGGKYLFNCQWAFQANASGQRVGYLIVGGVTIAQLSVDIPNSTAAQSNVNYSVIVPLNAGEYAEMHTYQDSGTSLNALGGASYYTSFQCTYLGA